MSILFHTASFALFMCACKYAVSVGVPENKVFYLALLFALADICSFTAREIKDSRRRR